MEQIRVIFLALFLLSLSVHSCKSDDNSSDDVEICSDGIDNDGDGFTDCDDADCEGESDCAVEICNDSVDNDGDGFIDCEDADCELSPDC